MRTTLTLDPDNAARLERLRKARDASLKEVINDALRRGLDAISQSTVERPAVQVQVLRSARPLIENVDNIAEVLAVIEGEDRG